MLHKLWLSTLFIAVAQLSQAYAMEQDPNAVPKNKLERDELDAFKMWALGEGLLPEVRKKIGEFGQKLHHNKFTCPTADQISGFIQENGGISRNSSDHHRYPNYEMLALATKFVSNEGVPFRISIGYPGKSQYEPFTFTLEDFPKPIQFKKAEFVRDDEGRGSYVVCTYSSTFQQADDVRIEAHAVAKESGPFGIRKKEEVNYSQSPDADYNTVHSFETSDPESVVFDFEEEFEK